MKHLLLVVLSLIFLAYSLEVKAQYQEIEVTDGGTIKGVVKFVGQAPKLEDLKVTKNPEVCGDHKPLEALLVGEGGGLENVVVSIEGITKGKKISAQATVLDNNKCVFIPHVQAMVVGGDAEIRNSDPILHNTHSFLDGKATVFNFALPIQGQKLKKKIKKAGLMNIQCDAGHTWMSAYVIAKEHPYFAVTGKDGTFEITDVPAGSYKVHAWHEGWKVTGKDKDGRNIYEEPQLQEKEVTVPKGGAAELNFEFK